MNKEPICEFNVSPPCTNKPVAFPVLAGYVTPMCEIHYNEWLRIKQSLWRIPAGITVIDGNYIHTVTKEELE